MDLQEKKTGKSIKKKALVSLVVICALVMAGFVGRWAYGETQGDSDAITYRAKDQTAALGTRENPFTVLELVPDRSMAAVGYLIPGCEPVDNLENDVTGTRVLYERCFASGEDGIVSVSDTAAVVFWPDRPDLGISNEEMKNLTFYDSKEAAEDILGPGEEVPEENILSAGQYGYFVHAPGSTGAYIYVPAGQEESGDQEADPAQPQDPDQGEGSDQPTDPDQGADQEQKSLQGYFKPKTVDDPPGIITYNWVPLRLFSEVKGEIPEKYYVRVGTTYTDRELETEEDAYMEFVPGGIPTDGVFYTYTDLVDNFEAQLLDNNKNFTMEAGEIGTETDVEGMRFYQYRCEPRSFCYSKGKIQHKDQLIQTLFPGQSTAGGFVSQVVTVTPEQLNRNRDDSAMAVIRDADMIVIHDSQVAKAVNEQASLSVGGQAATLTKFWEKDDINNDIFQALVKKQASGNPAMMLLDESAMDECVTMQADTANPKHQRSNLEKLYTVLNKYGAKRYYNVYCKDTDKDWEYDPGQNGSDVFTYTDHIRADHAKGLHTHMGVAGYVCNWDGDDALFSRLIKDQDTLTAFGGMYQEAAAIGYKDTLNILELHPAVPNTADGKTEADVQKLWNEYYTSRGYRGWRDYYLSLCPWFVGRDADIAAADESGVADITVTRKATYEFNGDIEDLNAVYDMIVIGSYQDDSCGLNGYNDTTMGNLAYTTVGDMMDNYKGEVFLNKTGDLVYPGYKDWDTHETLGQKYTFADTKSAKGTEFYQSNIRYSGTDVTAKKFEELVEFCQKDLIVVDANLYKGSGAGRSVNDGLVDKNSLLHVIADIALHPDNQVQHVSTTQDAAAKRQYVGKILCHMAFSDNGSGENGRPVTYAYTTTDGRDDGVIAHSNYNTQTDDNNHNVLQYHFTLEGEASVPYEATVYIDSDGNGYFEEDERTDYRNLIVQDNTPGERNRLLDLNRESLAVGHTYTVTRVLPDSEQGILPWKLVTYVKGNPSIRDSATGLTRVKSRMAERETIHVLQMNLHTQMKNIYNRTDNAGDSKDGDWASDPTNLANADNKVGKQFRDYIKGVEDYDVRLTYMTNQDWMARFDGKPEEWKAYLLGENGETGVDMLVLGFRDSATFTNNATYIEGFKAFVAADRAVILSHDMVQDKSFAYGGWGTTAGDYTYTLNNAMYLRNLSAQQKKYYYVDLQAQKIKHAYAYTYSHGNKISLVPNEDLSLYYASKVLSAADYRYQVPGTMQYAGTLMDNPVRAMLNLNNLLLDNNYKLDRLLDTNRVRGTKNNANKSFAWTYAARTDTVMTANEGQITAYPYDIPEQISVATTHVQNYKLDLEEGMPGATNIRFNIDGDFSDWDDVPHTSNSYNTINYPNESTGCLVDDTLYVHTKAFNSSNGSAFNYMEVTLTDSNGKKKTCGTHLITGTGPDHYVSGELWGGLEDGIHHFEIICSGSWNSGAYKDSPDCVFGEAYVKVENGVSEIEYKVDMNKFVSHTQGHWGEDLEVVFDENATLTLWQSTVGPEVIPVLKDDGSANQAPTVPQIEFQEGQLYQRNNTGTAAIVWYNLSGGRDVGSKNNYTTNIYSAREGDSANNYYIYTKENITYTGFGHNVSLKYGPEAITSEEVRLFINTMISAYRSKTSAPYLTVTNPDVVNNSVYSTLYMEERDILADTANVDVHLTLRDDSIDINRNKVYHITVKDTAGNEVRISGWGNYDEATHSYIGVKGGNYTIPVSLKDMTEDPTGMKTYVLETYATYESNGSVKTTPSSKRIVRVMRKPLFGLH